MAKKKEMFLFNQWAQQMEEAPKQPYRKVLRCFSVAFNVETHTDITDVDSGGKIFLPQSALEYLRLFLLHFCPH